MHMNYEQPTKSKVHVPQVYSHCTQIKCSNPTFRLTKKKKQHQQQHKERKQKKSIKQTNVGFAKK